MRRKNVHEYLGGEGGGGEGRGGAGKISALSGDTEENHNYLSQGT
jgi:hypothetical protein